MPDTDTASNAAGWDSYWASAASQSALTSGESGHPAVIEFWRSFFSSLRESGETLRIIDIASGNGAVIECAAQVFGDDLPDFTCLDASPAAVQAIENRFPRARAIVADAAAIPADAESFDIATSQFGFEYAGLNCLDEVARIVAPGGHFIALLHHRGGAIYSQCAMNLGAARDLLATDFLPLARRVFATGVDGAKSGDRSAYQRAGKDLAPAIRAVEAMIAKYGNDAADGLVVRLYRDVRQLITRMNHYERAEALDWFDSMQREIEAYAGRMAAMLDAAVDDAGFDDVRSRLEAAAFDIERADALAAGEDGAPVAWALIARKR